MQEVPEDFSFYPDLAGVEQFVPFPGFSAVPQPVPLQPTQPTWRPPPVRPLPLTQGTSWQIDFGQVPSRVKVLRKPADEKRARFRSYESASAFLNYAARGHVRPEQPMSQCAMTGVVAANVAMSYTPYPHAHQMDVSELSQITSFSALDPDDSATPQSVTLQLLPASEDGHTHTVDLTLSQAKSIVSGRPLGIMSSGPDNVAVDSHAHLVSLGC